MATLKFRAYSGYGWVTDVREVTTGVSWDVPADQFSHPGSSQPSTSFEFATTVVDHGLPAQDEPSEGYVPRESWRAVEVLVKSYAQAYRDGEQFSVHIVSAGECWLMDEGGRTIDRIP